MRSNDISIGHSCAWIILCNIVFYRFTYESASHTLLLTFLKLIFISQLFLTLKLLLVTCFYNFQIFSAISLGFTFGYCGWWLFEKGRFLILYRDRWWCRFFLLNIIRNCNQAGEPLAWATCWLFHCLIIWITLLKDFCCHHLCTLWALCGIKDASWELFLERLSLYLCDYCFLSVSSVDIFGSHLIWIFW